jgi:thioredoxin reductase
VFDCIIIGGGFAGLQAAIQLGRYNHHILVLDSNDGRSTLCNSYHNILGYPEGVSGKTLRDIGRRQAESFGVQFKNEKAETVRKLEAHFLITTEKGQLYKGKRLLIATGIKDRIPSLDYLKPCLGKSIYVCPDCDGYEVKGKRTIVIGSGNVGAHMALTLTYWTRELIYINHEQEPVDEEIAGQLNNNGITYICSAIREVLARGDQLEGYRLTTGEIIQGAHSFIAFGGNEVRSDIASQLGVERLENKHIVVNPRTNQTSIPYVWAAGDVVAHTQQVTVALGDGSLAAIWIHKSLLASK